MAVEQDLQHLKIDEASAAGCFEIDAAQWVRRLNTREQLFDAGDHPKRHGRTFRRDTLNHCDR